ncbi:hypothetical protein OFC46_27070, partial [Escherichia coli]|nr:hypothetical protein [Escherichia coli]
KERRATDGFAFGCANRSRVVVLPSRSACKTNHALCSGGVIAGVPRDARRSWRQRVRFGGCVARVRVA